MSVTEHDGDRTWCTSSYELLSSRAMIDDVWQTNDLVIAEQAVSVTSQGLCRWPRGDT